MLLLGSLPSLELKKLSILLLLLLLLVVWLLLRLLQRFPLLELSILRPIVIVGAVPDVHGSGSHRENLDRWT